MSMREPFPPARSSSLPEGVSIQPRAFEFRELESVPQYWFGNNPIVTHVENTFSIMIPPGERFFIRSVRYYEDRAVDPEVKDLIRAFIQQEGLHTYAHNELNRSFARFGVEVEREVEYADRYFANLERRLPRKVQLGVTAFLEHLTAVAARMLFIEPKISDSIHPEMLRFWRWHAAEELEHKAVAFDLFKAIGGGYLLRVCCAIAAILLLTGPFIKIARRMLRDDPTAITPENRQQTRELNRAVAGPELRMIAAYFKPGFHPWQYDDAKYLSQWYDSAEVA